jgi:hypothetical protein
LCEIRHIYNNLCEIRHIYNNTGQQNLTFFLSHEEKYLILIVLLTLNSNT